MGEEPAADAVDLRARRRRAADGAGREPPIPVDLFVRVFADYERAKTRAGRIDFDDLLIETVDLLEGDAEAAETVRARKRWFSVDEYQDTNPLQQRLLELWLGERHGPVRRRRRGPDDLHVHRRDERVPHGFAERHPGAREIDAVARTTARRPQVLELANRLLAAERPDEAPRRDAAGRAGADDRALRDRGGRAGRPRRAGSASGSREGVAAGGDRGARPDERPARADRGRR